MCVMYVLSLICWSSKFFWTHTEIMPCNFSDFSRSTTICFGWVVCKQILAILSSIWIFLMRLCPFCFMKLLLANGICMIPLFVYLLYWYCIVPVICSAIHFQKSVPFFVKFQQLLVSALLSGALAFNANSLNDVRWSGQGSFPVRKRTRTLRIWRARERKPIWGSGGEAPWSWRHFTAEESKYVTLIY